MCPRSQYLWSVIRDGRWKVRLPPKPYSSNAESTLQDGVDGHIALIEDDPEVIRLLLEYFYLLDFVPSTSRTPSQSQFSDDESRADSSDSISTLSRDPAQYGNIYGTSAVSAFGGPHPQSPYPPALYLNRSRTESHLTVHAMPLEYHGNFGHRERGTRRSSGGDGPEVSPLATSEPNLVLHARMYAAARKFGVDGLKALALDKFKIQLTRHW